MLDHPHSTDPSQRFKNDRPERDRAIDHILKYELFRHRDLAAKLSDYLSGGNISSPLNRSTWDIVFYLMQCYLEGNRPSVTDIYVSTGVSKGTAISGIAELETRGAINKARDSHDGRRRRIELSNQVISILEEFVRITMNRLSTTVVGSAIGTQTPATSGANADPLVQVLNRLSHELRTPLTAIVGFAEMIANQTLGPLHPAGYTEYARDIRSAALALLESLNEHVDSTLAERNHKLALGRFQAVDFELIVDDACRTAATLARKRKVILRRQWGSASKQTQGDQARLVQAVRKLLERAIKLAESSSSVEVQTISNNDNEVSVRLIIPHTAVIYDSRSPLGTPNPNADNDALALARGIFEAHEGSVSSSVLPDGQMILTATLPVTAEDEPLTNT